MHRAEKNTNMKRYSAVSAAGVRTQACLTGWASEPPRWRGTGRGLGARGRQPMRERGGATLWPRHAAATARAREVRARVWRTGRRPTSVPVAHRQRPEGSRHQVRSSSSRSVWTCRAQYAFCYRNKFFRWSTEANSSVEFFFSDVIFFKK